MNTPTSDSKMALPGRGWLIASGIVSILVGFLAMSVPVLFSGVIAVALGILAVVTGVFSLGAAVFGKDVNHRILNGLFAIIRIAAGLVLIWCVPSGIAALTLVLAVFLIVEGISAVALSIKMRSHKGWGWMLANGLASLALGIMIYAKWPADSLWILGLFYGINSLFFGVSALMLGLGMSKPAAQVS